MYSKEVILVVKLEIASKKARKKKSKKYIQGFIPCNFFYCNFTARIISLLLFHYSVPFDLWLLLCTLI